MPKFSTRRHFTGCQFHFLLNQEAKSDSLLIMGLGGSKTITVVSPEGAQVNVKKENLIQASGWVARNQNILDNSEMSFPAKLHMTENAFFEVIKVILGQEPTITHVNRTELYRIGRKLEIRKLVKRIDQEVERMNQQTSDSNWRQLNNVVSPQIDQEAEQMNQQTSDSNRRQLNNNVVNPQIDQEGEEVSQTTSDRNRRQLNNNVISPQIDQEGEEVSQQTSDRNRRQLNNVVSPQIDQEGEEVSHQTRQRPDHEGASQMQGNIRLYVHHNGREAHADIPKARVLERLRYFETHRSELNTSVLDMSQKLSLAQFRLLVRDLRGETIKITDENVQDIMQLCAAYNHEYLEQRLVSQFQSIMQDSQQTRRGFRRFLTWKNAAIAVGLISCLILVGYLGVTYLPGMIRTLLHSKRVANLVAIANEVSEFLDLPEVKGPLKRIKKTLAMISTSATAVMVIVDFFKRSKASQ